MAETDLHNSSSIDQCRIIDLGKNHHPNGNLTVAENGGLVPFDIKRVFYIYDVPGGETRGGHSHKALQQVIVAISGAVDVLLDDGVNQRNVTLNRPYQGLLVAPGVWSKEHNFSSGAVCLVLASDYYDESDYLRDYDELLKLTFSKRSK